jgi:hypothetical protein
MLLFNNIFSPFTSGPIDIFNPHSFFSINWKKSANYSIAIITLTSFQCSTTELKSRDHIPLLQGGKK